MASDVILTPSVDLGESVRAVLSGAWRQRWIIGLVAFVCSIVGLVYALTAEPLYTSSASLVIDPRISNSPSEVTAPMLLLSDQLLVDSEVKVLASRSLSDRLVDRLGLLDQPYEPASPGLVTVAANWMRELIADVTGTAEGEPAPLNPQAAEARRREELRRELVRPLTIERSGETYVVIVSYTSPEPAFAAEVVNALVDEYFLAQAAASLENTQRVNDWLADRVDVVAQDVALADAAVEDYRRENNLYTAGEQLPATVELRVANDQLIATRSEVLDLTAQIAQLEAAIRGGNLNITVTQGESASLARLRETYAQARERERELLAELDEGHELVQRARADQARTRQLILEELGNVAQRLETRVATLRNEEERIEERIAGLQRQQSLDEAKSIRLRELERETESKRRLYESMLEQLNATAEQTTFAATPARVIASAVPPVRKSAPNTKLIVVLATFGGLVLGGALAFLREALNDTFLLADDVKSELGLPLIGLTPRMGDDKGHLHSVHALPARLMLTVRDRLKRDVSRATFAADNPLSMFAETLRALDMRLCGGPKGPGESSIVVGFTSASKGEGKTTLAANFAAMKAALGYHVAVIDLDVRAAGLTALMGPKAKSINTIHSALVAYDSVEEPMKLPGMRGAYLIASDERRVMLADPRVLRELANLLDRLRADFDYVVIDLPPLNGLVDANIVAPLTDQMVLALEWGQTRKSQVNRLLPADSDMISHFIGAIYTKVPLKSYASYNGSSVREYYSY